MKPNVVSDVIEMLRPLASEERRAILRAVAAFYDEQIAATTLGRVGSVDREKFAADWENASSVREVSNKHKIREGSARTLASNLRKKGIKLKMLRG